MLKKLGLIIALGTVSLATGCDTGSASDVAKNLTANDDTLEYGSLYVLAKNLSIATSEDITTDELEKASLQLYNQGYVNRKIPILTLGKAIDYTNKVSEQDKDLDSVVDFTEKFIELSSKHKAQEIFRLLDSLNKVANEQDDTANQFIKTTAHILEKCDASNIEVDDFIKLVIYVDSMKNKGYPVTAYGNIISYVEITKKLGVEMDFILDVAKTLENRCSYFDHGTPNSITESIYNHARVYKNSGVSKEDYISELDYVVRRKRCGRPLEFVLEMQDVIKNKKALTLSLNKEEVKKPKKQDAPVAVIPETSTGFNPENYKAIALDQYLANKPAFKGKEVKIFGVPAVQTLSNDTYVLKIKDEGENLDCIYLGDSLEAILIQNDVKYVMKLNEKADIKKRIMVYGTFNDDMLKLDAVKADTKVRGLQ